MDTSENLVLRMNELLEGEKFFKKKFDRLINGFLNLEKPKKLVLLDFEYYNEERMRPLTKKKINYVLAQNFETAKKYRDLEREFESYISLKQEYNISKSMFFYEYDYLFYFHLGTSKIDKKLKEYIKKYL